MAVYLVTWELNKAKPNYNEAREKFMTRIKNFEYKKDSGLDSVVFISTTQSSQQLSEELRQALDNNDSLVVTKMNLNQYWGLLKEDTWKWIKDRL
jgi:hypothetical protein